MATSQGEQPRRGISRRTLLGAGAAVGAGMALTTLEATSFPEAAHAATPKTKEYWIQCDSFAHNLVPTGFDEMMGMEFEPGDSTYNAIGFRAYTPNWGSPLPADDDIGPNTGIPGPIIRAAVGQTVLVHFKNNDTYYGWPHSMHTHGFRYTPTSDGSYIAANPDRLGGAVELGETYTYTWTAESSSVGTWLYHDHAQAQGIAPGQPSVMEFNAELGMFGMVAITDHSTPKVDREFFLFFHDLYQADVPVLMQDFDCFNGAAYLGNTPTYSAQVGQKVRWRVAALGKEFHVFHIHGHRWKSQVSGRYTDSEMLGPSTTLTVEYTEDNPGSWLYHCHVTDHMAGGMVGAYLVTQ